MQTKKHIENLILLLSFSFLFTMQVQAQSFFNLGLEYKLNDALPVNWQPINVDTQMDSINKIEGNYALMAIRTEKHSIHPTSIVFQTAENVYRLRGKKIDFKAKIKTDFEDADGKAYTFIQAIFMQSPEKNAVILSDEVNNNSGWNQSSVSYQIDEDFIPDILGAGVIFMNNGKVHLDDCEIRIDDKLLEDINFKKEPLNDKEIKWIDNQAIPVMPEIKDKTKLIQYTGHSRIVGLGEATHGSASIIEAKNSLTKALIEEGSFTLLAIEDGAEWAEILNQYVLGHSEKLPRLNMNIMYANTKFLEFIEWLRTYNQTREQKVRIVGPDLRPQTCKGMLRDLDKKTQNQFTSLLTHITEILEKTFEYWNGQGRYQYMEMSLPKEEKELIENGVKDINDWIDKNIADENEKTIPLLYTRNIIQYCSLSKTMRDKAMADNIQWLLDRHPGEKLIYTAHNSHIGVGIYTDSFSNLDKSISQLSLFEETDFPEGSPYAGWYLRQYFGDDYYPIGITFFEGTNHFAGIGVTEMNRANPGSCEYLLNMAKTHDYFLDLRKISCGSHPEAKWLQDKFLIRNCGSGYSIAKEFSIVDLPKEFDAIVLLRKSVSM